MSTAVLETPMVEKTFNENEILELLWDKVEKPKNYLKIKVVNVYDNAYRINIWCEYDDPIMKLKKVKIGQSYFCKLYGNELVIR